MYTSALKPFAFNTTDIEFLLAQVKFKALFDVNGNAIINWNGVGAIYDGHGNSLWNGTAALPGGAAPLDYFGTSYQNGTDLSGLRDPSGLNNNLALVNSAYGAVDQIFPRMAPADYTNYVDTFTGGATGASIFGANATYWSSYGGVGFDVIQKHPTNPTAKDFTESTNYAITVAGVGEDLTNAHAANGTVININNIVDYTPRMISLLTTTAGVVYDTWANHPGDPNPDGHQSNEIYYDANGVASVLTWGALDTVADGGLGQVDTQARFAGSPGVDANGVPTEHFIGGLNPGVSPSNGFFVLFGQFFDHGLDFIDKGAQGATIKITFSESDPLYGMKGPDGQPVHEITMARASVQSISHDLVADVNGVAPGGTGYITTYHDTPNYTDHTSPFIDQSQTYGSHEQLTTLLREWVIDPVTGNYHAGMKMLDGQTLATAWKNADGEMVHDTLPTLNELRQHIIDTGRAALNWEDVLNLRNRDMSDGHITGGDSGSALILDMNPRFDLLNLMEGNAAQDMAVNAALTTLTDYVASGPYQTARPGDSFGIGFDPAHPTISTLVLHLATAAGTTPAGDYYGANAMAGFVNFANMSINSGPGAVHDAISTVLLASVGDHYIAGDGRVNENFGLTSIHHVFHEEHNFQVGNFINALHREAISTNSFNNLHSFQVDANGGNHTDNGDFVTYTAANFHAGAGVVGETKIYNSAGAVIGSVAANNVQVTWDLDKMFNASKLVVEMEYQHAAVDQYARNVTPNIQEFVGYSPDKDPSVTLEYAQSIFRWGHSTLRETIDTIDPSGGLTGKIMGYALRDAFLNPDKYMDLGPASILLGMTHQQMNEVDEFVTPALNQGLLGQPLDLAAINIARGRDLGIPTLNDFRAALGLSTYTSWTDFGNNMQHPSSLVNFIAAYSFDGDLAAAQEVLDLVDGVISVGANGMTTAQAFAFLEGGDLGFNKIDTWIGGLAELHQPGGLLGETFDLVFLTQIESLMDGDRFYYLFRLAGQQFAEEVGGGQLKDIVERNTGLTHLNGNIFGYADKYVDLGTKREVYVLSSGGNTETQTTSNNHKYGDVVDQNGMYLVTNPLDPRLAGPTPTARLITTADPEYAEISKFGAVDGVGALNQAGHENMGIYTNSGRSSALDGSVVTVGGVQYIRDTRLEDINQDTGAAMLNDGVNLDGTPNSGAESNEIIVGTDRNDLIYANGGDDTVYGEGGDDIIYGGFGIDRLYGGDGSDHIYGSDNPDLIDGGSGDDFVYGESSGSDINGNDQVIGGSGNDYVSGGVGIDKLSGGTGDDHVVGDGDTDPFTHGSDGNDLVEGNSGGDILYGDNGDDVLVGGADQDQMFGGNGDDIIKPGDLTGALTIGTDETLGGDGVTDIDGNGVQGFDIIDFSDNAVRAGGVTFNLADQINPGVTVNGTPTQTQAFQMEGVIGSAGDDTLTGGSTNLAGNTDNDWIIGGSGNDKLAGGAGNDVIIGGSVRLDKLIGTYQAVEYYVAGDPAVLAGTAKVGEVKLTAGEVTLTGSASTYDHNNNNNGATADQQLMDARYQGASHRVGYADVLAGGYLDAVNGTNPDGVTFDSHFQDLLRSDQFKNTVLGDGGTDGLTDVLKLTGNHNDYTIEALDVNGDVVTAPWVAANFANVYAVRITDNGHPSTDPLLARLPTDGTDLIIGVEKFSFADGDLDIHDVFGYPPELDLHAFDYVGNAVDKFQSGSYNTLSTAVANGGTINWAGAWTETGDNGSAGNGQIRIASSQLRFVGGAGAAFDGASIQRTLNLGGQAKATISYDIGKSTGTTNGLGTTENVKVYFAADGVNFVLQDTINSGSSNGPHSFTVNAPTGGFSNVAALRFETSAMTQGTTTTSKYVSVDNVNINVYSAPADGQTYTVTYAEPSGTNTVTTASAIALNPSITDLNDATMQSAKVVLTDAKVFDVLTISGVLPAGMASSVVDTRTTDGMITLNLTGNATLASYQTALSQVRFYNTSNTLDTADRHLDVTVFDGLLSSNVSHALVHVTAVADGVPVASIGTPVVVTEGAVPAMVFTVSLSAASGVPVTVNYSTTDGTAVAGSDYTNTVGTLTIPAGNLTGTISVPILNDTVYEATEAFTLNLAAPTGVTLGTAVATGTINDNDAAPVISIGTPVAVTEGGVPSMQFTVSLSAASALPVMFSYATANGTAIAGSDYTAASGNVTIAAGSTIATITVPILNDNVFELTEAFTVDLSAITGATAGTISATGMILDDDPLPSISVADVALVEGNSGTTNMVFTLSLSGPSSQTVTVNYATANGTATAGSDYTAASGTAIFAPGSTSAQVVVAVNGDTQIEVNDTLTLNLSGAANASIATASVTGTITNDDGTSMNLIQGSGIGEFIDGTAAADLIYAGGGDDLILARQGDDYVFGEAGNDILRGRAGSDYLDGGDGTDTASYFDGSFGNDINLATGIAKQFDADGVTVLYTDTLVSIENVIGSDNNDVITGNGGDNVIAPGAGNDTVTGGGGNDKLDYSSATSGVWINFTNNFVNEYAAGGIVAGQVIAPTPVSTDIISGFNSAIGSAFDDRIRSSNSGNNYLSGGNGDDLFFQNAMKTGVDFFDGGANGVAGDTYELRSNDPVAETFDIYTAAYWTGTLGNALGNASTEIVVTKNGTVLAELDNIEEIIINSFNSTANNNNDPLMPDGGVAGGDTINVHGDFTSTSLNYSTITINGSNTGDTVNISDLTSAHRIVFNTSGGNDVVIGDLRPQDVVNGALGAVTGTAIADAISAPIFTGLYSKQAELTLDDLSFLQGSTRNGGAEHISAFERPMEQFSLHLDWVQGDDMFHFNHHAPEHFLY